MSSRSPFAQATATLLCYGWLTCAATAAVAQNLPSCNPNLTRFDAALHPSPGGAGVTLHNTHQRSRLQAGIDRDELRRLQVEWALLANPPMSLPFSAAGVVFSGSGDGGVYAVDPTSGCVHWRFQAQSGPTTSIGVTDWSGDQFGVQRPLAYFADDQARVYVLDMLTGQLLWSRPVSDHQNATITGAPVYFEERLFVPVAFANPDATRTSSPVIALAIGDGDIQWELDGENAPVAGGVRHSPVVDAQRDLLVFATDAENGAIVSANLSSGHRVWTYRPESPARFVGGITLTTSREGSQLIVVGDDQGVVHAVAAEDGALVWRKQLSHGTAHAELRTAMASDNERIYVPLTIGSNSQETSGIAALAALDLLTGQQVWSSPATNLCQQGAPCAPGIDSAAFLVDGVIVGGHMDGRLIAYDGADGSVFHREDFASRTFSTLSGGQATLTQFTGGGISADNGRVFATGVTVDGRGILLSLRPR